MADKIGTAAEFKAIAPEAAMRWFKSKGYAFGFDWRDVWKEEHAIAFTVAKAASLDILQDIRGELEKALAEGTGFDEFKANLQPRLAARGWWGRQKQKDPLTGEVREVQLGSPRRLKIIYDTNINQAYNAGEWERIEDAKAAFPALQYKNNDPAKARPTHRQWHNRVFWVDDPFWNVWTPSNGWNCKCWLRQISKAEIDSGLVHVEGSPKLEYVTYHNKRTGETTKVPKGIDPGFDYNVGKARARAYTPPPLGGLPETCQNRTTELPPLPKGSKLPKNAFLPGNLKDEDYINAFLAEFGTKIGKTAYFEDKVGDIMPVNEELFRDRVHHTFKSNKQGRGKYMKLLASGLKEPDEIWLQWIKAATGAWILKKRYIKVWEAANGSHCLTIFDRLKDGWRGTTSFPPKSEQSPKLREKYIDQFRDGLLLYKKKSSE